MTNQKNNAPGFTLIELIVVVAILAVLATVAMPTLISYLNAGDIVKCRENIGQVAKLGIKYGEDMGHRNLLPTSGMDDDEDTPGVNENEGWWVALSQQMDTTVVPEKKGHGVLKVGTIFHCPGDRRATVPQAGNFPASVRTISYVSWTDGSEDESNPESCIRTVGKKHLDTLPWLSDGIPVKGHSVVDYSSFRKMVGPVLGRHSDTIIVAYASGVVRDIKCGDAEKRDLRKIFRTINPDGSVPTKANRKH